MQNTVLDSTISNSLQLFQNAGFKIRVIMRYSDPWFVAKDVATCIEHSNVSKMCELCRDKDKIVESASNFDSNDLLESGNARITLISESGLYRILAKCNLPKCEPFESWVFDEVLPSIRKTGNYSVEQSQQQPKPALPTTYLDVLKKKRRTGCGVHPPKWSSRVVLNDMSSTAFEHRRLSHDNENIR